MYISSLDGPNYTQHWQEEHLLHHRRGQGHCVASSAFVICLKKSGLEAMRNQSVNMSTSNSRSSTGNEKMKELCRVIKYILDKKVEKVVV